MRIAVLLGLLLSAAVPCPGIAVCWGGEGHFAAARTPAAETENDAPHHCPCDAAEGSDEPAGEHHGPCRDLELEGLPDAREIARDPDLARPLRFAIDAASVPTAMGDVAALTVVFPRASVRAPARLPFPSLQRGVVLRR